MKTMAAGKAKAQFLGLLDEVKMKRESVMVTKYGKPWAKLVPLDLPEDVDPLDKYLYPGRIEIVGDIMAPLYTDAELDEFDRNSIEQLNDCS
jgi:prevent-host-death family protein